MKRILSLVMAASILLQTVIPVGSMVTYAEPGAQKTEPLYGLKWEKGKNLNQSIGVNDVPGEKTEALVSWNIGTTGGTYTLEYFVENEGDSDAPVEKVQLEFTRDTTELKKASVTVKMLDSDQEIIKKPYNEYDFSKTGENKWVASVKDDEITLDVIQGSPFPGGRIRVGANMEMRFRWGNDNTIYVQSSAIKNGNITPFTVKHDTLNDKKTGKVEVLTGIDGYKISPYHIQIDADKNIKNTEQVILPGDQAPGSKPGVKIEFKRPRGLDFKEGDKKFKFKPLSDEEAEKINAELVISELTNSVGGQLSFNLGSSGDIETGDLDNKDKKFIFKDGMYNIYMAEDHEDHPHIVKLKGLKESMIFKQMDLDLRTDDQIFGEFKPAEDGYTYLGYEIKRANAQDAYIVVHPYREGTGAEFTYTVRFSNGGAPSKNGPKLVEQKYRGTDNTDSKPFTIPIPFLTGQTKQFYQIEVMLNNKPMYSQVLYYQPGEDKEIPPPTPMIESIDNIYAVPPKNVGGQPEAIGFDLTWSAPKNSSDTTILDNLLKDGNLYYELSLHNEEKAPKDKGTLIKVFKVSSREDGEGVSVVPYAGTAGKQLAEGVQENIRYNAATSTFTMENVVLKKGGLEEDGWEHIMPIDYAKYPKEYPKAKEIIVNNNMNDKKVPGIYYLTMQARYETTVTTGPGITFSNDSNPKPITISQLDEVIPFPTKIESRNVIDEKDLNRIRQSLSWDNIDLFRYIKQMLDPLNLSVSGSGKGTYEVYLYQKRNIEKSKITSARQADITLNSTDRAYKLNSEDIKTLREDGVLRLDYEGSSSTGMNNITLEGLDANQVYYSVIKVRLDIKDKEGKAEDPRHSVFSKEHSFTTYVKPGEPGPSERVPPVPEKLEIIHQSNNTTATIGWKAPEYKAQGGEELYYEMARVDFRTLAKEEDSRLISVEDLIKKNAKNDIQAWRTKKPLIEQYEKGISDWKEAAPQQASSKLQLEDENLSPNKIYYYYVRTVLMVDGEESYSSWIGVPVTTEPIKKPIQLKIEDTDAYSHDPKREIVVSFLAPVPKGASIPSEYDFDIAVQGELDDDYRLDYSTTRLTSKEAEKNIPTGYVHFVYKIRDAKPGKRYDIKVRVIDKVVDRVDGEYPKSLYSDRVTTRTHFDQDEQDKDDKFREYLKYFEDKVEALRRKPYWILDDGRYTFSVKYRSNYIMPEMTGGAYQLAIKDDVLDFNYYMPAEVINSANLGQTSFEIKQGTMTYSVRPLTITNELEELRVILEDIAAKDIKDYYVLFHFSQIPQSISPSGTGFLSPKITVDIELVRLQQEDLYIEDGIMIDLNKRIENEKTYYIKELEKALDKGKILKEDLDVIIDDSLGQIQEKHQKDVKDIIKGYSRKTRSIHTWNKQMLITATVDGTTIAEGYSLDAGEKVLPTFNVAGGYAIQVDRPGAYIFKGQKITMPVIPGISGATDIVAKYQLTDFFGINGQINPNNMAIKKDVLGAMARVLGAQRGTDYVQYLKQVDVKGVSNIGMNLPMKKGEGIYLLMQVYEKNLKKPIGSVYIKNRNIIPNIREFNPMHQTYALVAADSKIMSMGSGVKPNDTMKIKDILEMLTNILTRSR